MVLPSVPLNLNSSLISTKSTSIMPSSSSRMMRVLPQILILFFFFTHIVDGTIRVITINDMNDTDIYTAEDQGLVLKSSNGLMGNLVKSDPPDACTKVSLPPDHNGTYYYGAWILLATWKGMEDPCPLLRKIRNADAAGYLAIIIQRPPGNESDFIPDFDTSDWYGVFPTLSIFPCLVSFEDGKVLGTNFTTEDYIIKFEDEPISTWLGFFIATVLVILAILLAIGLSYVIVQMFLLILLWVRETIVNAIQQRRRDRRRRLPASQLKKLPVQQWTTDIPQDTCTICLDNYAPDDRVRILPCSHVFHMVCIDPWLLNQRRKCPNCKGKIVFPDERYDSDTSTEDERTPLIRRGSSVADRERAQIFSFNEHDVARHNSMYTAIHRIFDEAANLPRPQVDDEPAGPSPTPHSLPSSVPTPSDSNSIPHRIKTFIRFKSRFGNRSLHNNPGGTSEDIQPVLHSIASRSASTASSSCSPESPSYNNSTSVAAAGSSGTKVGNLSQTCPVHLIDAKGNKIIENFTESHSDEEGPSESTRNNVQTTGSNLTKEEADAEFGDSLNQT